MHEDLSSMPRTLGMVMCIYNPSTMEERQAGCRDHQPASLACSVSFRPVKALFSKEKNREPNLRNDSHNCLLATTCTYLNTHEHIQNEHTCTYCYCYHIAIDKFLRG